MGEKHTALVLNIGTYPEEDAAYELLNNLSLALPLVVVVTWVLDALLAAAYLKWLHPWKIILQEVSLSRESDLNSPLQEPEKWELEEDFEGASVSQVVEVMSIPKYFHYYMIFFYIAASRGQKYC